MSSLRRLLNSRRNKKGKSKLISQAKINIPQEALFSAMWQAEST